MAVNFPTGLLSTASDLKLASVVYKAQLYQALTSRDTNQVPRTLTLELYADKIKQTVSSLSERIEVTYPVDDPITIAKMNLIANGSLPKEDVTCASCNATTNVL